MKYSEIKFNRTVKSLVDAIIKLVSQYAIKDITVEMILQESNTARRTFYKYFEDKYALINYVHYHDSAEYIISALANKEAYIENISTKFTIYQKHSEFYAKAAAMTGQNCFPDYYWQFYLKYWETFLEGYYGESFYNEYIKHTLYIINRGSTEGTLQWFRDGAQCISPTEKAHICYERFPDFIKKAIEDPNKDTSELLRKMDN